MAEISNQENIRSINESDVINKPDISELTSKIMEKTTEKKEEIQKGVKIRNTKNCEISTVYVPKKRKKPELINMFFETVGDKTPDKYKDLTRNKLRKTKNSKIIDIIAELRGCNKQDVEYEGKAPMITNNETIENLKPKFISKSKREAAGKALYKLNCVAIGLLEVAANTIDKSSKYINIKGISQDMSTPQISEKFIDIYKSAYDDFPRLCDMLTNWKLNAGLNNVYVLQARHSKNRQIELENQKKKSRFFYRTLFKIEQITNAYKIICFLDYLLDQSCIILDISTPFVIINMFLLPIYFFGL
jgi:hypothetical protein